MLKVRVIPCLLLQEGGLVKTEKFKKGKYVGDPINAIKIFNEKEVDELIFLDIDASKTGAEPDYELLKDIATESFMPLAYGGGVKTLQQIERILKIGVEKVVINHAALKDTKLIEEAAVRFGSSTIVAAIDIKKDLLGTPRVYDHVKEKNHTMKPADYAVMLAQCGAGELFLNSVDRDGTFSGYDTKIIKQISGLIDIPLIASGGAKDIQDFRQAVDNGASAVSAGSMFVFQGPHKAVLITYPSINELAKALD